MDERFEILLVNEPDPEPLFVLVERVIVGLVPVLHTTPLEVIGNKLSLVAVPPLLAEFEVISEAIRVDTVGEHFIVVI